MKVCIVFHKFQPENEGISISIDRLTKNLKNVEFHIVTANLNSSDEDIYRTQINTTKRTPNIFVHRIGFINKIDADTYPDSLDNLVYAIETLHKKHHFDLIHSYYLTPNGYIGTLVAKKLGIPSLVGVRGNDLGRNYLDYKRLFWINWTLQNADYLTFLNEDLLDLANAIYPCKDKSQVIMNSSFFPYELIAKKVNPKNIIFGYWGDLKRKKGIIYLIDAASKIKSTNFSVKIMGDASIQEKQLYTNLIKRLGIGKRIKFYKSVNHDSIANWVSGIDIFVFPTINDGCPNVVFEAMYLQKPTISTTIAATKQILEDKVDSILVEPRNADELSKAMEFFIQNPDKVTDFGLNAKENVTKKYAVNTETSAYLKIYKKIIE